MSFSRRAALLAGLGLLPWPAFADPHGRGKGNGGGNGRGNGGGNGRGHGGGPPGHAGGPPRYLGGPELNVIQVWMGGNPGFYAQPLPPGMRNRLAQGKPLPPGIARRAVPHDLLVMLPHRPGYEYAMIGTSLVLVAVATGIVASVLTDALLRR
jgi:hypothetical protein